MKGYLHSIESFSTLDGPGIRSVVFLQGCPLRCLYCHNPESWIRNNGIIADSSAVLTRIARNQKYISKNGGVTVSGGEPFYQTDFLQELLKGFKAMKLHTAVDTSGYAEIEEADKVIDYTDLFIVDIKHMEETECQRLTGRSNKKAFRLLEHLEALNKDVWIRSVLVPGSTDSNAYIKKLYAYVKEMRNVKRFELLPLHDLAKEKSQPSLA